MPRYFKGKLRESILDRDGNICVNCGSDDNLEIDHILNVSMGGSTSYDNGQVLCAECNQEKEHYRNMYTRWLVSDKCESENNFKYAPLSDKIISEKILKQIKEMI